jgi:predicted HAD superfamily Cof-like phosphohydrolase
LHRTPVSEEYEELSVALSGLESTLDLPGEAVLSPAIHKPTELLHVTYGTIPACGIDPNEALAEIRRTVLHKASGPRHADGKHLEPT